MALWFFILLYFLKCQDKASNRTLTLGPPKWDLSMSSPKTWQAIDRIPGSFSLLNRWAVLTFEEHPIWRVIPFKCSKRIHSKQPKMCLHPLISPYAVVTCLKRTVLTFFNLSLFQFDVHKQSERKWPRKVKNNLNRNFLWGLRIQKIRKRVQEGLFCWKDGSFLGSYRSTLLAEIEPSERTSVRAVWHAFVQLSSCSVYV